MSARDIECLNCGHGNPADDQFCGMCGNKLRKPAVELESVVASILELFESESQPSLHLFAKTTNEAKKSGR
jgi:Double zinc ribbon